MIAVDIGRYGANTAITVIKVLPESAGFRKNLIYTEVIHGENYVTQQAPRVKK